MWGFPKIRGTLFWGPYLTGPKPQQIEVETFRIDYLIRTPKVEKWTLQPISYNKAPTIWGTILGSRIFGNSRLGFGGSASEGADVALQSLGFRF